MNKHYLIAHNFQEPWFWPGVCVLTLCCANANGALRATVVRWGRTRAKCRRRQPVAKCRAGVGGCGGRSAPQHGACERARTLSEHNTRSPVRVYCPSRRGRRSQIVTSPTHCEWDTRREGVIRSVANV